MNKILEDELLRLISDKGYLRTIPETGFMRLPQILGNPKSIPPTPPIIPVSKSTWWDGIKTGRYPQPVKLGPRITVWTVESIRALISQQQGNVSQGESHV